MKYLLYYINSLKLLITVLFVLYGIHANCQKGSCELIIENIKDLINLERIDEADSVLLASEELFSMESQTIQNRYNYYRGLSSYYHKDYENALNIIKISLTKLDSMKQYGCDDYIKIVYYVSDCLLKLNKKKESEETIKKTLIKCTDNWESCSYVMKLYDLLFDIYQSEQDNQFVINQLHYEKQYIGVNIYDQKTKTNKSKKLKNTFINLQDDIRKANVKDSSYYYKIVGMADIQRKIGNYDESLFLYTQANDILSRNPFSSKWNEKKRLIIYNMILNYSDLNDNENVLNYCKEFEKLNTNNCDIERKNIVLFKKGIALFNMGRYDISLSILKEVYHFLETQMKTNTPMFVMTTIYLDSCYFNLNDYSESIKYAYEALHMYEEIDVEELSIIAHIYHDLGRAHFKSKEFGKAIIFLKKSADIQKKYQRIIDVKTNRYINECKKYGYE